MKKIIDRIFKHYITSILGVCLLLICSFFVYIQKATFTEVSPVVIIAIGFIASEDPKKKKTE